MFYGRLVIAQGRSQLTFFRKGWTFLQASYNVFFWGGEGVLSDRDTRKVMQFLLENGLFGGVAHTYSTLPQEVVRSFGKLLI
jgi:hypothetical protein